LTRIESGTFSSSLQSILIPSTILFIASDAVDVDSQIRLTDGNSSPEFDRWLQLRRLGIRVNFRRIQRVGSGLRCLTDYEVDVSRFGEVFLIRESDEVRNEICHRVEDQVCLFVRSIPCSKSLNASRSPTEIENLMNLRHPCIAGPIGFISRIESGIVKNLKIVVLYLESFSLEKVISDCPIWWTSTRKAKAIVGIVLGLRFVHSFGLVHGHLTSKNILCGSNDYIEIVSFESPPSELLKMEGEERLQFGGFSRQRWTPENGVHKFALILFEIMFGYHGQSETSILTNIPNFISMIIKSELDSTSTTKYSFDDIFSILKRNNFKIEDDVDSAEVSKFVSWVELAEHP
jgi:hypothetical protein